MLFLFSTVGGTIGHVTEEVTFALVPTGTINTQNCDWWKSSMVVYFVATYLSLLKHNLPFELPSSYYRGKNVHILRITKLSKCLHNKAPLMCTPLPVSGPATTNSSVIFQSHAY